MAGDGHARLLADLVGDLVVKRQIIFAAPAIEGEGIGRGRTLTKDRAGIPQPDIAKATGHNLYARNIGKTGTRRL